MNTKKGTFSDPNDGRVYKTIKIGNQIWMAENLNAEKYRNGDPIPNVPDDTKWGELSKGGWCYYNNESKNENASFEIVIMIEIEFQKYINLTPD